MGIKGIHKGGHGWDHGPSHEQPCDLNLEGGEPLAILYHIMESQKGQVPTQTPQNGEFYISYLWICVLFIQFMNVDVLCRFIESNHVKTILAHKLHCVWKIQEFEIISS